MFHLSCESIQSNIMLDQKQYQSDQKRFHQTPLLTTLQQTNVPQNTNSKRQRYSDKIGNVLYAGLRFKQSEHHFCCVLSCSSNSIRDSHFSFFRLPLSKKSLLKQWVHAIGRKNLHVIINPRICSKHLSFDVKLCLFSY